MSGQYMTAHQVKRYLEMQQEIERLRDLVDFAIAAIDSNHCYMGEEAQVDLRNYLKEMIA
jgi:hypothetical protein